MKRIAVIDLWHPYRLCFSWSMASILAEQFDVVYVTTRDFPEGLEPFPVVRLPLRWPEKTDITTWLRLPLAGMEALVGRRIVKRLHPDLIYFAFDHPLLRFFSFANIPMVNTVHEFDDRQGIVSRLNNITLRGNLTRCSAVVTMNPAYHKLFTRRGMPCLHFVHPPYAVDRVNTPTSHIPLRLLFFGKIRPDKGIDLLLDAACNLQDQGLDFMLTIAGNGDLDPYAEKIEELGQKVHVINRFIPDPEVLELLHSHDLAILPYRSATQSGVATLCNSCGLPMVTADLPELAANVTHGQTGMTFPTGDGVMLVRRLAHILQTPSVIPDWSANLVDKHDHATTSVIEAFGRYLEPSKNTAGAPS